MGADVDSGVSVRVRISVAVAIFAGAFALYAKTIYYPFTTLDDPHYVSNNLKVDGGLTLGNVVWAFTTGWEANWHPLTWLSLQLDATLAGGSHLPAVFRGHNIVLHAATAALMFWALVGMTDRIGRSAIAAALWAAHPQHVESVVWITERKDVLSGFYGMVALVAYTWHARQPSAGRLVVVAVLLGLGLMAKPMLVTLPFAFLLLDFWPLGRTPWAAAAVPGRFPQRTLAALVLEKLPLLWVVVLSSAITFIVQQRGGAMSNPFTPATRVANAVLSYWAYLRQTVVPNDLAPFYEYSRPSLASVGVSGGLVLLGLVTWAAWAARGRAPYLLVGWLWFLGTLVPMIGLVQVGNQARADRYMYLPHVGLFVGAVWAAADLIGRATRGRGWVSAGVGVAVVAAAAAATDRQAGYWRTPVDLWDHAVAVSGSKNVRARENLGTALMQAGRNDEAEPHLRAALAGGYDFTRMGLAIIADKNGRPDEAVDILNPFFAFRPEYSSANQIMTIMLLRAGRAAEAGPYLRRFDAPRAIADYVNLIATGREHLAAQDIPAARAQFAVAARDPELGEPRFLLGVCDEAEGKYTEAEKHYRDALRLSPTYAPAHARLGILLNHLGRTTEAEAECRKAVEVRPKLAIYHAALGQVLGDAGKLDEAKAAYEKVVELEPGWPQAQAVDVWKTVLGPNPKFDLLDARTRARQACEASGYGAPEVVAAFAAVLAADANFADAEKRLALAVAEADRIGMPAVATELRQQLAQYQARRSPRDWKKPPTPATDAGPKTPPAANEIRID